MGVTSPSDLVSQKAAARRSPHLLRDIMRMIMSPLWAEGSMSDQGPMSDMP